MTSPSKAPAEALRFALWLEWGTRIGMVVMVVSFVAYLSGWWPARIAPAELERWWGMPLAQFIEHTRAPTGWQWLYALHHAENSAVFGVAVLASCAVPALLALVPLFHSRGDRRYVLLSLAVALVLVVAASGLVSGGH